MVMLVIRHEPVMTQLLQALFALPASVSKLEDNKVDIEGFFLYGKIECEDSESDTESIVYKLESGSDAGDNIDQGDDLIANVPEGIDTDYD